MTTGPAFFFHLGDVVYNFGEGQYYYDQFYEPFRGYDRPIFAIPGNHDGMVFGDKPDLPRVPTLTAFLRNFCAEKPGPSPDAGALVRSTMNQPGVYFTLDAPFVSIVGLYTNVLEGPGVISSQGGKYSALAGDEQLHFLEAELARLAPARKAGERAVIVACHHPPASVDAKHGGSSGLADDIDTRLARGRLLARRRPLRPRPPLPALHAARRRPRDPLHRRRLRRLLRHAAGRRAPRDPAHRRRVHPRQASDRRVRLPHRHRRHDRPRPPPHDRRSTTAPTPTSTTPPTSTSGPARSSAAEVLGIERRRAFDAERAVDPEAAGLDLSPEAPAAPRGRRRGRLVEHDADVPAPTLRRARRHLPRRAARRLPRLRRPGPIAGSCTATTPPSPAPATTASATPSTAPTTAWPA